MPQITFESITESLMRLPAVIQSIPDIVRNPAANPLQATILLGIGLILLLIIVLSVLLMIMRPSAEEEALLMGDTEAEGAEDVLAPEERARLEKEERRAHRAASLTVTSIIILVGVGVWMVAGLTTGASEVCTSCHFNTSHAAATADPHKDIECVQCHEGGGKMARLTVNVATRFEHVAFARTDNAAAAAFGQPVASDGCRSCHKEAITGTFFDEELQLKVVHSHPLEAGAQCVDCHALTDGVVNAKTVGMAPCLRCHDGTQAKADCNVCHVGDPSQAIRPSVDINQMAAAQVPNPQCDGCHKDQTTCMNCHGIEMPHSQQFRAYGHAREAVIDIWYGDGKKCEKCHYGTHNGCIRLGCHSFPIAGGHPNPAWAKMHQKTQWSDAAAKTACACHDWNSYDHNGMIYCQICHETKPKNAR